MTPSYTLGLIFIFLVSLIWSAASVLVQYLYQDLNFNSPFLLTYIGSSLFVIFIPSRLIWERRRKILSTCYGYSSDGVSSRHHYRDLSVQDSSDDQEGLDNMADKEDHHDDASHEENHENEDIVIIIPWRNSCVSTDQITMNDSLDDGTNNDTNVTSIQKITADNAVAKTGEEDICSHDSEENTPINSSTKSIEGLEMTSIHTDTSNEEELQEHQDQLILSHIDHIKIACKIAPVWFLSNYCYNLSLSYTSITSSTVLASTGSIFTFLFALSSGDEQFTKWKCIGVFCAFLGSILTSIHDQKMSPSSDNSMDPEVDYENNAASAMQVWGDIAGIVAAIGYGGYTVLIRILCPSNEERMSMQLLLGYVGLFNMIIFSPIGIWVVLRETILIKGDDDTDALFVNNEPQSEKTPHLTWFIFGCLIVKGLSDNVLSDYLWARAIILTSATVATVGLGLTVPLALLSDLFIMHRDDIWGFESVAGAILVLVGFGFVNIGEEISPE